MRKIIYSGLVVLIFSVTLFGISEYHAQEKGEHCDKNKQTDKYECAKYDLANFIRIKIVSSLNHNEGATVGLATIVLALTTLGLAIYTAKLWGSTERLMLGAEDTAKRQLRAYVFQNADIEKLERHAGGYVARIDLSNAGKTPAYKVGCWANMGFIGDDEYKAYPFTNTATKVPDGTFVINPGSEHTLTAVVKPKEGAVIDPPNKSLYIWGAINYIDAFHDAHTTSFRLYRRVTDGLAIWAYCDKGNEAD